MEIQNEELRRYQEWKNSPEGIHYNLTCWPPDTSGDILLVKTVSKLPNDIREIILDGDVVFILPDPGLDGSYWQGLCPGHSGDKDTHYIFVNLTKRGSQRKHMQTIAHEIAHFISHHANGGRKAEMEADDLCEQWGFGRAYESYERFPE